MTPRHENTHWQNMFARFLEYKRRYKHCFVPRSYGRLGLWCDDQRIGYRMLQDGRTTHMTRVKIELLESEGFCWEYENKREKKWHEMYAELLEYRKEHGHCNVPKKCRANQKLGSWVDYQRTLYRQTIKQQTNVTTNSSSTSHISYDNSYNNSVLEDATNTSMQQMYNPNAITPERIKLLEDIGFRWSTAKEFSNTNTNSSNNKKKNKDKCISRNNEITSEYQQQTKSSCLVMMGSSPDSSSMMGDAPTVISNSSSHPSSTSSSSSAGTSSSSNVVNTVVPQVKRNASPLELLSMVAASEARNNNYMNISHGGGNGSNVGTLPLEEKSRGQATVVPSNTSAFTARMQQSSSMMSTPPTQQNQHQYRVVYTAAAHHPAVSTTATGGGPVLIQQVAAPPRYEQQLYHSYATAHPAVEAHHHHHQVVRTVHHYCAAAAHHPQVSAATVVPMHHHSLSSASAASVARKQHPIHY